MNQIAIVLNRRKSYLGRIDTNKVNEKIDTNVKAAIVELYSLPYGTVI